MFRYLATTPLSIVPFGRFLLTGWPSQAFPAVRWLRAGCSSVNQMLNIFRSALGSGPHQVPIGFESRTKEQQERQQHLWQQDRQ